MKKQILIILITLGFVENVFAETLQEKIDKYIFNNLSFEYIECQHYLMIMSEALKTNNPDPKLVKNYVDNAKLVSEIAFMYGEEAGMSIEGMLARSKQISDKMLKSLNNNFANIAVIQVKYADFCKSLIETPEIRNQYWIIKAQEKYQ
ncbi:hypothetical protein [Candidatus Pelagibacter sp.]|uniref:hypothetical protein n=1 Tax=Candidatus Pelagibacter sp. TaxID=2024849 RepID=UPI003F8394CA